MKQVVMLIASTFTLTALAAAQSMTIDGKLELKVTKVERVTEWEAPGARASALTSASSGNEFAKVHFTPRWLAGASGDPCSSKTGYIEPGTYELLFGRGGSVRGMQSETSWGPNSSGCAEFTVLFQESPAGASLTKVRVKGSEADISKLQGAQGTGDR